MKKKSVLFLTALSLFFFLTILPSCKIIKSIKFIKDKSVHTTRYSYMDKEIILVELTHFGQIEFYEKLKDSINVWKNSNYRVYYEIIQRASDSTQQDILMRKWRKINGGVVMKREDFEQLKKVFKHGIVQPEWEKLGITEFDLNADIGLNDLITEYENRYGEIELDDCDMKTSFKTEYSCSKKTKNNLSPITVDFRNQYVVNLIKNNNDKKIVVIYGARHKKGILKLLKEK